ISHWPVPGGEGSWKKWDVASVLKQKFVPAKIGDQFGPVWSTHWFKVSVSIPDEWNGLEIRLRWKSQSEAMVWDLNGVPLQGLSTGTGHQVRTDFRISGNYEPNVEEKEQTFLIEMACSRMFGVGKGGMINPPNMSEMFTLELVELCVFDVDIHSLIIDLECLHDLASNLSEDQRGYRALYAGNQMINELIAGKVGRAKEISQEFFSRGNGESSITLALIGNCHIDSAWLWPYSETKRKCARSWAATLRLMEDYPEMIFACSQAQQFEWTKQYYPHLYDQIKEKSLQGKFMHVGATWVEMDGLVPSGESFVRQFLYGQKFYLEEFGSESNIFWLPDTFGYSAQIPQICKHFEIPYFLTQKLSWSLVNKFPNHTFNWEGIDGSSILAHFPPGDSYEMNVTVKEALKSEQNLRDKGRVSVVGFLYGFGDGGGGPTQDMLERARRLANVDGCPRMKHMSPLEMFRRMESEEQNYCRWTGELYLELHNGTYTSQAKTKAYNRKCEFMLRNSEILLSILTSFKLGTTEEIKEMRGKCESAWKKVLLNQFHDVLPGSSIGIVYEDSDRLYEEAIKIGEDVSGFCIKKLSEDPASGQEKSLSVINFFPWLVGNDGGPEAKGSVSVLNLLPWPVNCSDRRFGNLKRAGTKSACPGGFSGNPGKKYIGIEAPPFSFTSFS
ncbi:UNVERIFIED_CONTAM: hypothetical protein GTU68_045629, partial [Idotea baltica]|nr:hypothetical protein [Idotea baltica]